MRRPRDLAVTGSPHRLDVPEIAHPICSGASLVDPEKVFARHRLHSSRPAKSFFEIGE